MVTIQEYAPEQHLSPRSIPLREIWSAITSEVGDILSNGATPATMTTTTVTVDTTIVQTVTLRGPTDNPQTTATICSGSCSSDSTQSLHTPTSNRQKTSPPAIVTETRSRSTSPTIPTVRTDEPVRTSSATGNPTGSPAISASNNRSQIIGGLAGAIAALIFIGILVCFCLRRRRRRRDEEVESFNEKGLRPVLAQKWSQFAVKAHLTTPAPAVAPSRSSTPDFDGGPIRVSLDRWPRPFAHGEGFRESVGPGLLRVTNPDPSRPTTPLPRESSDSHGGFFKQRTAALAAALLRPSLSRGNSSTASTHRVVHDRSVPVPAITVDPALSDDYVAQTAPTPSFRSYPSVSTLPYVQQRPPEDPFLTPPELTPPDESAEHFIQPKPGRPGVTPLQNAAGAASRTLSHVGSALNPFRTKSNAAESVRSQPRHSFSTFSSAGDPFKLDRPSLHENTGRAGNELERHPVPRWNLYEGT